jgi:ankyrin repeat protein
VCGKVEETALMIAAIYNSTEVAKLLLENNALSNMKNKVNNFLSTKI